MTADTLHSKIPPFIFLKVQIIILYVNAYFYNKSMKSPALCIVIASRKEKRVLWRKSNIVIASREEERALWRIREHTRLNIYIQYFYFLINSIYINYNQWWHSFWVVAEWVFATYSWYTLTFKNINYRVHFPVMEQNDIDSHSHSSTWNTS